MDVGRVVELYAPAPTRAAGEVASGYRLTEQLVLTAAHAVTGLPVAAPQAPVPDTLESAGMCQARPIGQADWVPAVVVWRNDAADVAVVRLSANAPRLPPASPSPRFGRMEGTEPIAVSAVGFPWAQERPNRVRDTEHLYGFVAPAAQRKSGQLAVTVLTSPPTERTSGSPWAGMSGAGLFAGPFLIGVVVVDPDRFGTDRVVAAPFAPLLADSALTALLGTSAAIVTPVAPRLRLALTGDTSLAVTPPYRPPTAWLGQRQPARLLLPEYGIVPFLGREQELQALQAWCLDGASRPLRLLLGAGGAGKSRLAAEVCVRMAGHGWQAGVADPDTPGGRAELTFDRATLLVIDDADLHGRLLEALVRILGYWPPDAPPVRLLLLARHTTGWWAILNQRTDHLTDDLAEESLALMEGELPDDERATHHLQALTAFTRHLPNPADAAERTAPDLTDAAFANPLLVHMTALLAAASAEVPTTGSAVRERVLDAVLDRERARWAETFPPDVSTGGETTRQQAIAAATLFAPPDEAATVALLTLIGDFTDAAVGARAAVATWLHELYPGAGPPWISPLRPDLLTEQLLTTCPDLAGLVLTGYDRLTADDQASGGAQVAQLLTELTRAATRPPVRRALDRLLAERLPDLLTTAIADPAGQLPDLLSRALALCPQPQSAAAQAARLPERSIGLAALAVTLTAQAVAAYRDLAVTDPDTHTPALAASLNHLSVRLADLGRAGDALTAIDEAVTLRRRLAAAHPDAYAPDLSASLNNLSNRLADLGRAGDALTAIDEAVTTYRTLAAAQPDAYTPDLAGSLNNLSNRLADLGRAGDALTAIEEAVILRRRLAATQPDAYAPALARSLHNLSNQLADLGRAEDALTAIEEAVTLRRRLAATQPDAFTPDLASSLQTFAYVLAELGRDRDALAADEEAVTLYRGLNARHLDRYRDALATALRNLAIGLRTLGRDAEAEQTKREAAGLEAEAGSGRPGPVELVRLVARTVGPDGSG